MKLDPDIAFTKLMNPRMSAGLVVLHTLLGSLKGPPIPPKEVREAIEQLSVERNFSKQSITNAARRLEEAGILERDEGYSVNFGYLLSVLLSMVAQLHSRVSDLEEELDELKQEISSRS